MLLGICVVAGELTLDRIQRRLFILSIKVLDLLAKDQGKLDLIVQVDPPWPDHRALAGKQDGRGGLLEKERLLGPGAVEFCDVVPACKLAACRES